MVVIKGIAVIKTISKKKKMQRQNGCLTNN